PTAPLILHPGCPKKYPGTVKVLAPGQKHQVGQVTVEAVPAYNLKPDRLNYHPKKNNWVGYILTIDGTRLYHAGDTDFIPEMKSLKVDIALLPIGGTYTMDAAEAAEAAAAIKPQVAVPMHFGKIVGKPADGERFRTLSSVPVTILPQGG
ncbi:MAG: MBL fold metallo-hydrolase, partial [bacterium]